MPILHQNRKTCISIGINKRWSFGHIFDARNVFPILLTSQLLLLSFRNTDLPIKAHCRSKFAFKLLVLVRTNKQNTEK